MSLNQPLIQITQATDDEFLNSTYICILIQIATDTATIRVVTGEWTCVTRFI